MVVTKKPAGSEEIWVFAYGSLCWKPDFAYADVRTGYVAGFARRFWQGNVTHRGTRSKPGRVATLVPHDKEQTWGCAYRLPESSKFNILKYLEHREVTLGGYMPVWTNFVHVVDSANGMESKTCQDFSEVESLSSDSEGKDDEDDQDYEEDDYDDDESEQFDSQDDEEQVSYVKKNKEDGVTVMPVLCYIAVEGNSLWMREDCEKKIAAQVREAQGFVGPNVDYVLNLHFYLRRTFPYHYDPHLEEIVKHL